jgi:hypothetical protein
MDLTFEGHEFARYRPDATPRPHLDRLATVDGVQLLRVLDAPLPGGSDDHPHHRGIWWGHRNVNGADVWTEYPGHGSIVSHGDVTRTETSEVVDIAHEADWLDASGDVLLSEQRTIRAHRPNADGTQALDLEGTLIAGAGPVRLGDTKEAGLVAVRLAPSLEERRGGQIQTATGAVGEAQAWGTPARWCAYSGLVGDAEVGLAVFDHPSNPRHPVRWHVRDYGLLAANPFGLSDFLGDGESDDLADGTMTLAIGERATFRYRLLTFRGAVDAPSLDRHFERFADA